MGRVERAHKVDFVAASAHQPLMTIFALPFPDISPEIFTLELGSFAFSLRWYALAYIVGLIVAWRIVVGLMKRPALWGEGGAPMTKDQPEDLLTWIILGVVLGGRLGYVMFYQPGYYLSNPAEILKVWEGGMSFHGGFLGVVVAGLAYCWKYKLPAMRVGDAVAVSAPIGLMLGRIANFINAELWGRPTDMPWGFVFPGQAAQDCPGVDGLCARHPSQLYEAGLEGLLLATVMLWLAYRRGWLMRPGAMIGVFLTGYGLARGFVEFFRQPDAQFVSDGNPLGLAWHLGGYGLTMGQILSLPMIVLGLALIVRAKRR
ncbi:Prolipoprotein diacylglyceryl transferase [Litoreibacter albidus]|uniref:Phosphatidylglycerol--prolipoprotein diacylglyceryl transferase n=2 Tax=Litoreibacter albidus TaxID=670155 RepID=A0A1H2Z8C1_9RHOB|nr:Prolipoprotein diacylglyceryl transferase [Litoreibacter albidus]